MKDQINEELSSLSTINRSDPARIHSKLEELIKMLDDSDLSEQATLEIKAKFDNALKISHPGRKTTTDQLLFIDNLDKRSQRRNSVLRGIGAVLKIIISLLLILLGFGMIIMPAPAYFEMFTLFYLNENDGVTIMDVISLLVAFIGVYLLVNSLAKGRR